MILRPLEQWLDQIFYLLGHSPFQNRIVASGTNCHGWDAGHIDDHLALSIDLGSYATILKDMMQIAQ